MTSRIEHPGLAPRSAYEAGEADYFEQAYDLGDGFVMRARFTPQPDPTDIADQLNTAGAPRNLFVAISRSLVDDAGQVIRIGGTALVRDATGHKWMIEGPQVLDLEAWLDAEAMRDAGALRNAHASLSAGELLIARPAAAAEPVSAE